MARYSRMLPWKIVYHHYPGVYEYGYVEAASLTSAKNKAKKKYGKKAIIDQILGPQLRKLR